MPQLEEPTTEIYNYVLGGFGEKIGKKKQKKKIMGSIDKSPTQKNYK